MTTKRPTYATYDNGLILSAGFDPGRLESALRFRPRPDDVFISTYPKCGTTWMQCILHMMRNGGRPLEQGQNINHFVPHIESDGAGALDPLEPPRVVKTHLPYALVPKGARYVYVARNPKDCVVSYFHHTKGFPRYYDYADGRFDDFFELFLEGQVDFNCYFDHLLSWATPRDDVLFLLYEEMQRDIRACVRKMGRFLGGPFLHSSERPDLLERIVHKSSLREMKATPSFWSTERAEQFEPFIRKGEVGDWRSHLSEDQSRRMDDRFREKLSGTVAEHLWDDYDCIALA